MLVNRIYEIPSCDDIELNIKQESMLEFKLCYDNEQPVKATYFIAPGLDGAMRTICTASI